MVFQAAAEDPTGTRPAMTELYQRYQQPLYLVAKARGLAHDDACEALQEFFCRLLEGNLLTRADQSKGRFRAYLLTSWRRFLTDQFRLQNATKRGGGAPTLVLEFDPALVQQPFSSPLDDSSHELEFLFDRQWAENILQRTRQLILADYQERGRTQVAETLFPYLTTALTSEASADLGKRLDLSPTAIKVALHRLRGRYGHTLRSVVAETVDDPADINEELDLLLKVMGQGNRSH